MVSSNPVRDADCNIVGAVSVVRDITERKKTEEALKESELLYRTIARNFPDGAVYVFDRDLRFRVADGEALATLGYTREALEGKTIWEATDPETCRILEERYPRVLAGESLHFETSLKDHVFSSAYVPIRDEQGNVIAGLVVSYDITARKQVEVALRESQTQLAWELEAAQLLQDLSTLLIQAYNVEALYDKLLDTLVKIMRADFAIIQQFHPERGTEGELRLLRGYGFGEFDISCWEWITPHSKSSCGLTLKTGQRVAFVDVLQCDYMADGDILEQYRHAGIRAVQSTPLLSRTGAFLGIISTHWREPHELSESEIRSLDVLARQAGDLIDRIQSEEALRESREIARQQLNEIESIYNSAHVGLCVFDRQLRFKRVNEHLAEINGVPIVEHIGRTPWEVVPALAEMAEQLAARIFDTGEPVLGIELNGTSPAQPDVQRYWIEHWLPLKNKQGWVEGINVVIQDITELKNADTQLRKSEERYRYLTEQLQEADYRKDEFLGILSHEIRNPLTAISMSLSLLDRLKPDGEKAGMMKEIMARQVTQLSRLIDDLLDVTRINRNKIVLQKSHVNLGEIMNKTIDDFWQSFQDKEISLETELTSAPLYLDADKARLTQIMGNLLHNAVKFTQRGGIVKVAVTREQQYAVIQIEDNGEGMTPETLATLFTPFMQANNSLHRGEDSGLGLGLVLVKGLVGLQGGTVTARSDGPGKGAVLTVHLPLARNDAVLAKQEVQTTIPYHRRRVLVVEDIRDVALSLKSLLECEGHEVRVAYNGADSIAIAKEFRPEILLCDIGLPGMDGYQVARAFRADDELANVFLVSVTGYARPKDLEQAKKAGFQLHIAKPVDLLKLRKALAEVG